MRRVGGMPCFLPGFDGNGEADMERWDAYDQNGKKLDVELIRGKAIPAGLYHLVVHVLVRHTDGSYLVTRRDWAKPLLPGYWEAGASGSVLKGEGPLEGAARELFEETGIRAGHLEPVDRVLTASAIHITYLCVTDTPKDAIVLQPGETMDWQWMSKDELLRFMDDTDRFAAPARERVLRCLGT